MAPLIDSEAPLVERLRELGVAQAVCDLIIAAGASSLSRLAFAIGKPGQPVVTADVEAFLRQAVGKAPTLAATAALKRVAFEAHTFLVATLRQQVE